MKEARLWYKVRDQTWRAERRQGIVDDLADVITEIDILYGDDEPFYGFQRIQGGNVLDAKDGKWESVDITYKRGNPVSSRTRPPRFHEDGTLKILQSEIDH